MSDVAITEIEAKTRKWMHEVTRCSDLRPEMWAPMPRDSVIIRICIHDKGTLAFWYSRCLCVAYAQESGDDGHRQR